MAKAIMFWIGVSWETVVGSPISESYRQAN